MVALWSYADGARLLIFCLAVLGGFFGVPVNATRYAAGNDILLADEPQLHLAYIVEDTDIMVKKTCVCIPRRHCINRNMIHLTAGKCNNPLTCCETTEANFDFDNY